MGGRVERDVGGQPAAAGKPYRHQPPDIPVRVRVEHGLAGQGEAVECGAELGEAARAAHREHGADLVARAVPGPFQRERRQLQVGEQRRIGHDRPPPCLAHRHVAVEPPAHADALAALVDLRCRHVADIVEVARCRAQVGSAPGDVRVAADGEDRQPRRHQPHRVIGGRVHAGDQPDIGNENAEMGVVGDERAAGLGAMARHREAVAAGPGEPAEPALRHRGVAVTVGTGDRRRRLLHQSRPQLVPARPCAEREQVLPDQPIEVGTGEAPHGQHVGDRPGFGLQAEHAELVGQRGRRVLIVVDAVDEAPDPEQRGRVHLLLDLRRGAAVGEGAQAVVDIDAEGADHLRHAPPRDHAHRRHLAEPQVRVDEAERERRVAVALGLDEGNLALAPVDRHAPLQRQAARGERFQALGDVLGLRQRREQRTARRGDRRRADGEPPGGEGEEGNHSLLRSAVCPACMVYAAQWKRTGRNRLAQRLWSQGGPARMCG